MTTKENKIYPIIPFMLNKQLVPAIKRSIEGLPDDGWALILDHDVLLVQHRWYEMCNDAINMYDGVNLGWLTCVTNKIGCSLQKACNYTEPYDTTLRIGLNIKLHLHTCEDMHVHFSIAENLYQWHGTSVHPVIYDPKVKLSGLFILTPVHLLRGILENAPNKFIGFDNWYYDRIHEAGYCAAIMPGLYVYHSYRRLWKNG